MLEQLEAQKENPKLKEEELRQGEEVQAVNRTHEINTEEDGRDMDLGELDLEGIK